MNIKIFRAKCSTLEHVFDICYMHISRYTPLPNLSIVPETYINNFSKLWNFSDPKEINPY